MSKHYQLIILGAGCAGLSLATRLAALDAGCPNTLILEQRTSFENDRTWCFWQTADAEAVDLSQHAWHHYEVRADGDSCVRNCETHPYCYVSGDSFYQHAQVALTASHNPITLKMQASVMSVQKLSAGQWQVTTANAVYIADHIVDTRPSQQPATQRARMWQSFYGIELRTHAPMFRPDTVTLMAMDAGFTDGLGFMYVLPTSPYQALLEYTVFSPNQYRAETLAPCLTSQLPASLQAGQFEHLRTEYGALPMGHLQPMSSNDPTYVYAGLFAGGARASSGYSFQRIQRWATVCAKQLATHGTPHPMLKDPNWLTWMDDLFLSVLLHHPKQASRLFFRFFSQPSVAAIAYFMNDRPTLMQLLQIVFAMPKRLFVNEWIAQRRPKTHANSH